MPSEFDRYTTPAMSHIWSSDWKLRRWAAIEVEVAKAMGAPDVALDQMLDAEVPSALRMFDEEQRTKHDMVAFLNLWRAGMGAEGRAWAHRGLTSSDIVDTANALRMKTSTDAIRNGLRSLTKMVSAQALVYRDAVRVGRTHGQHAEVTTWGWRLAVFAADLTRAEDRLRMLSSLYEVGKLSGPVGDYKTFTPQVEKTALYHLGLRSAGASTQIVTRDVYVDYVFALSQIANVIENMAMEVRLSARSEVAEVREGFGSGQRGSSSMPHKRNPIRAEQLCGLARVVRAQVDQIAQGVAVHHERDISHSSVERTALVTASQVTDYMIETMILLLKNLRVYPEVMRQRVVDSTELLSSHLVRNLVEVGVDPEIAYEVVFYAFEDWLRPADDAGPDSEVHNSLADALLANWMHVREGWLMGQFDVPDFQAWVDVLKEPEKLLGNTDDVYLQLDALVNPPDVLF